MKTKPLSTRLNVPPRGHQDAYARRRGQLFMTRKIIIDGNCRPDARPAAFVAYMPLPQT